MAFGKPGRPAHDAAAERLRIYAAAIPVIRRHGARAHMADMAEAAHMSVGGVYHYFDTKRRLLLHGLDPEALALACRSLHAAMHAGTNPGEVAGAYIEKTVYMFRLIQPSAVALLELGLDEAKLELAQALRQDADGLVEALVRVAPDLEGGTLTALSKAIRRTLLALCFDPDVTEEDVRRHMETLLHGFVAADAAPNR